MKNYLAFLTLLACLLCCLSAEAQQLPTRPQPLRFAGESDADGAMGNYVDSLLYSDPARRVPSDIMIDLENNFSNDMNVLSFLPKDVLLEVMNGIPGAPVPVGAAAADSSVTPASGDSCYRDTAGAAVSAEMCLPTTTCIATGNANAVAASGAGQAPSYTQINGKCEWKGDGGCRCEAACVFLSMDNCGPCAQAKAAPIKCPQGKTSQYATVGAFMAANCVMINNNSFSATPPAGTKFTNGSKNGVDYTKGRPQLGDSSGTVHSGAAAIVTYITSQACK